MAKKLTIDKNRISADFEDAQIRFSEVSDEKKALERAERDAHFRQVHKDATEFADKCMEMFEVLSEAQDFYKSMIPSNSLLQSGLTVRLFDPIDGENSHNIMGNIIFKPVAHNGDDITISRPLFEEIDINNKFSGIHGNKTYRAPIDPADVNAHRWSKEELYDRYEASTRAKGDDYIAFLKNAVAQFDADEFSKRFEAAFDKILNIENDRIDKVAEANERKRDELCRKYGLDAINTNDVTAQKNDGMSFA